MRQRRKPRLGKPGLARWWPRQDWNPGPPPQNPALQRAQPERRGAAPSLPLTGPLRRLQLFVGLEGQPRVREDPGVVLPAARRAADVRLLHHVPDLRGPEAVRCGPPAPGAHAPALPLVLLPDPSQSRGPAGGHEHPQRGPDQPHSHCTLDFHPLCPLLPAQA